MTRFRETRHLGKYLSERVGAGKAKMRRKGKTKAAGTMPRKCRKCKALLKPEEYQDGMTVCETCKS